MPATLSKVPGMGVMKKPDLTASEERTQAIARRAGMHVDEWRNAYGWFMGKAAQKAVLAEIDQMMEEARAKYDTIDPKDFETHRTRINAWKEIRAILARTEAP